MKTLMTLAAVVFALQASSDVPRDAYIAAITMSSGSSGHACAVNGLVVTNRHMVDYRAKGDDSPPSSAKFRYEFPSGQVGRGSTLRISNVADLAVIKLDKEPPHGYAKLGEKPKVGEIIRWVEYDFRKREDNFEARDREGKVTSVMAGMILIEEEIVGGASGGCAVNAAGEVVGIMTFSIRSEKDYKTGAGATAIYGGWWKDLE